ncbi:hypothetical protein BS50DRAFT_667373 [Corynespora cassiicola Philippines]|uniref:Uncharacterized protein n=1 Tax=Corynespora cassiicola Philippines TaxID=1448308 RepID=A0A2T2NNV7_CORCC|nr:hypothetical protein BS50DRAFT_667373 [Corynespora cassiicola Philippines]
MPSGWYVAGIALAWTLIGIAYTMGTRKEWDAGFLHFILFLVISWFEHVRLSIVAARSPRKEIEPWRLRGEYNEENDKNDNESEEEDDCSVSFQRNVEPRGNLQAKVQRPRKIRGQSW